MEEIELLNSQIERQQKTHEQVINDLEDKILALNASNQWLLSHNESLNRQLKDLKHKVKNKEKEYPDLIEPIQDIMYRISPEGFVTFISSSVQAHLGYIEEEIIGRHFTDLVLPEYSDFLVSAYIKMIEEKIETSYNEFPIKAKNGSTIWIGQTCRLLENGNLVAVARDISDRKIAEDSLNKTKSRFASLITNLQKGVLVEDEDGKIVLVNKLFCDIFDIPNLPANLIGKTISDVAHEGKYLFKESEKFALKIAKILDEKQIVVDEKLEMVDERILLRNFFPIFLENQYRGHFWEYSDITQQYISQELIRKSEEKYRGILNNVEMGLVEVDNDHIIIRAYDRFCKMVGYTEEELVGKNAKILFVPEEFDRVVSIQQIERLKGNSSTYELQLKRKDESLIWSIISGVPILGENGKVVGAMGIHYDINERKLLVEELEQAKQIAENAIQSEKQFLANMSHEIRTPLNAIIGMTHLLFDTSPSKQQQEYLDILKNSADFLLSLVSDLLDMAKIETGKMEVQNNPFDLVALLKNTQRFFQVKIDIRPVEISLMIDEHISGNYIGDNLILSKILSNIIGNAEKFTEKGSIGISVKSVKQWDELHWIEFKIEDTGIVMPDWDMDTVSQKIKQINAYDHKGMGLGLSITKQLVEILGGNISVKSEEEIGTTFIFTLPYKKLENIDLPAALKIQTAPKELNSCHILVAEDNVMNQKYISTLLNKWEINYVIAIDGSKAVEQAQKQLFDLILMDIQMPNIDGYEATYTIRNTKNLNQNTPIVALTASAMPEQKIKAMEVGMNDFVTKPFTPNNLLNIVQSFINSSTTIKNKDSKVETF